MRIEFTGNVGKDAQIRKVQNGDRQDSVVSIWVAENLKKRDGSTKTLWHKVTIWRGYADSLAPYLKAGRKIQVHGKAQAASYTRTVTENGKTTQQIVPYIDVQADEITLLDRPEETADVPPTEATEATAEATDDVEVADTPW